MYSCPSHSPINCNLHFYHFITPPFPSEKEAFTHFFPSEKETFTHFFPFQKEIHYLCS